MLQTIFLEHIPAGDVLAFGSRENGNSTEISDLDIAVRGCSPVELSLLREALDESTLPNSEQRKIQRTARLVKALL